MTTYDMYWMVEVHSKINHISACDPQRLTKLVTNNSLDIILLFITHTCKLVQLNIKQVTLTCGTHRYLCISLFNYCYNFQFKDFDFY